MAGRASRATISARGGTTGRAAGCPTKFGFAGGRNGPPLPCPSEGCGAAAPGIGLGAVGRGGVGIVGTAAPGRGAPGVVIMVGGAGCAGGAGWLGGAALILGAGLGASLTGDGIGWRGPERIWPGRGGGGAEREGITGPRLTGALGAPGCPVASGGRNGNAGRTGVGGASEVSAGAAAAGRAGSGVTGAGAVFATGGAGSATRASGWRTGSSRGAGASSFSSARPPAATLRRRFSTTSSSSELECVFLSVTPNSGNNSRMTFGLTSSSRASSLMRILLIRITPKRTAGTPGIERKPSLEPTPRAEFYFGNSDDSALSIVTDSFSGSLATSAGSSGATSAAASATGSAAASGAAGASNDPSNCP